MSRESSEVDDVRSSVDGMCGEEKGLGARRS